METPNQIRGHLAALGTIIVWGVTFISIKLLLVDFTPVEAMFYRLLLALAALFIINPPVSVRVQRDLGSFLREEWQIAAAGLCGVTLYFIFQNIALQNTQAANVSVLISVAPLFTALVSRIFLHEKLKANFFLGLAFAMAGIVLIAFNGTLELKINPLGDLLSVLAALVWAFYSVLIKKISARQGSMAGLTRKVFLYGLIFLLPLLPLFDFHWGLARLANFSNLFHLTFLGLVASALCFITWNYAVRVLGPVKTSLYIFLVPPVTIAFSLFFLNEKITLVSGAGMVLIMAGLVLSEWRRSNPA